MSCICQFHTPDEQIPKDLVTVPLATGDDIPQLPGPTNEVDKESLVPLSYDNGVSASDLSDCRAENWLLKKKLLEYEVTIENLEQLVTTIVEKQHQILSEMFYLRKENRELQSECHLQREYHSMERNALMRELHDARSLSRSRSFLLGCPSNPLANSVSSNTEYEEDNTCESDQGEECENDCDSNEDQGSDDDENYEALSAQSTGESSARTSLSLSDSVSCDTDSDEKRSCDNRSIEDTPISNSDTD
ncbi:uncharacterized protein [Drosophila takahashii]|uniref:uncharacterized protein n=1 Tax=Drosophila takahashii TaxID=29030 RepID=UPI001CF8ABAF|nr:uncharacterized protein LOC108066382 [Drosophila takahashii]